jgi:hypothetical protein
MTMTRINADGDVEAIKDRKVEARVEMLISGDLTALIAKRDELKRQADALQKKKEDESKVYQERKHCAKWAYTVKSSQVRDLRDMAAAYSRAIKKMTGV